MCEIVPVPNVELIEASDVPILLQQIRPAWQARDLINRVRRLISVDPSSACQRLFNAAIHDLREKVVIAGVDIARDAAKQHRLPPIDKQEEIENYPTAKLIDLAFRIGLLPRADWRRLSRCYEIRRDLEHEDDAYEAGVEDCVYIFQTCIGAVLARDPIHLIRVTDVKGLIEQPTAAVPAPSLVEDYSHAPAPRQEEILKFLVSITADEKQSDLVRQNAVSFLAQLARTTQDSVKLALAEFLQHTIPRTGPSRLQIRIAFAAGVLPYLKQAHLRDYFTTIHRTMEQVGYRWKSHAQHGEMLSSFKEIGGLLHCPIDIRRPILRWLVLAYLGEQGGNTSYGHVRHVFYSNSAAPFVEELITDAAELIREDIRALGDDRDIQRARTTVHIERRWEKILDLIER